MFLKPSSGGRPLYYFCGHSLGLQPVTTGKFLQAELTKWAELGVEGHFEEPDPWFHYHKLLKPGLAMLCGAGENEVNAYGSLSSNIHTLFATFYKPTAERYKILAEDAGFPSDTFALQSQVRLHGLDPATAICYLKHDGNYCYSTDYILDTMSREQDSLALIWLSGVNFLSGQVFDMEKIAGKALEYGITVGLDLAHAIGNVPMQLHKWGVDFAVWCSYKYLNAGPGATGGYFVHDKHFTEEDSKRNALTILAGWWGHSESTRFRTGQDFEPVKNADAWMHSNANVLSLASLRASLAVFREEGIVNLAAKRDEQKKTAFSMLKEMKKITVLTPEEQSGNMISLRVAGKDKNQIQALKSHRIIADWREPDILRFSFCPLYNNAEEWALILQKLKDLL